MAIEILVKGRFRELPDAMSRKIASNAWEVTVHRTEAVGKLLRGDLAKALDGAVLVVDDKECEPAVVSRDERSDVVISVWAL